MKSPLAKWRRVLECVTFARDQFPLFEALAPEAEHVVAEETMRRALAEACHLLAGLDGPVSGWLAKRDPAVGDWVRERVAAARANFPAWTCFPVLVTHDRGEVEEWLKAAGVRYRLTECGGRWTVTIMPGDAAGASLAMDDVDSLKTIATKRDRPRRGPANGGSRRRKSKG